VTGYVHRKRCDPLATVQDQVLEEGYARDDQGYRACRLRPELEAASLRPPILKTVAIRPTAIAAHHPNVISNQAREHTAAIRAEELCGRLHNPWG